MKSESQRATNSPSEDTLQTVNRGANQSATTSRLRSEEGGQIIPEGYSPTHQDLSMISQHGLRGVIRVPRSYKKDKEHQQRRHLATALHVYLRRKDVLDFQEVQLAPLDKDKGRFAISTNSTRGNGALRSLMSDPDWVKHLLVSSEDQDLSYREARHLSKFRTRQAHRQISGVVPDDDPEVPRGFHAERRLVHAFPDLIDRDELSGTRRPCADCFGAIIEPNRDGDEVPQGGGARWGQTAQSDIRGKTHSPSGQVTHFSMKKLDPESGATVADDTNTDSESEVDEDQRATLKFKKTKNPPWRTAAGVRQIAAMRNERETQKRGLKRTKGEQRDEGPDQGGDVQEPARKRRKMEDQDHQQDQAGGGENGGR